MSATPTPSNLIGIGGNESGNQTTIFDYVQNMEFNPAFRKANGKFPSHTYEAYTSKKVKEGYLPPCNASIYDDPDNIYSYFLSYR